MCRRLRSAALAVVILTVLAAASGCSFGWLFRRAEVQVTNDTPAAIEGFFARVSGTEEWGSNYLLADLASGGSLTILVPKEVYDFRATRDGYTVGLLEAVDLTGTEIYELSLSQGAQQ